MSIFFGFYVQLHISFFSSMCIIWLFGGENANNNLSVVCGEYISCKTTVAIVCLSKTHQKFFCSFFFRNHLSLTDVNHWRFERNITKLPRTPLPLPLQIACREDICYCTPAQDLIWIQIFWWIRTTGCEACFNRFESEIILEKAWKIIFVF